MMNEERIQTLKKMYDATKEIDIQLHTFRNNSKVLEQITYATDIEFIDYLEIQYDKLAVEFNQLKKIINEKVKGLYKENRK